MQSITTAAPPVRHYHWPPPPFQEFQLIAIVISQIRVVLRSSNAPAPANHITLAVIAKGTI
jgi:hypothetical protein